MVNDISNINEKMMKHMSSMVTNKQIQKSLSQSQTKSSESTEDTAQLRSNYRKSLNSSTQSDISADASSIKSTIQKMRSLAENARADSSAQTAGNAGTYAQEGETVESGARRTSERGTSIADALSKGHNADMESVDVSSGGDPAPIANIKSTESGSYIADANMGGGNEGSDFARFNAIAQQGAAMLSRDNAGSGQASNAGAEATAAASNSQVSEASSAMASRAVEQLNAAMQRVQSERANMGATQEKLQSSMDKMTSEVSSNMTNAVQKIKDLDISNEMMNYSKYDILTQQATAMLSQANQAPQQLLQLFR